jgi:hypothetical protein
MLNWVEVLFSGEELSMHRHAERANGLALITGFIPMIIGLSEGLMPSPAY